MNVAKKTITEVLDALGACGERAKFYSRFGSDWPRALKAAPRDDLEWFACAVAIPKSAAAIARYPLYCRKECVDAIALGHHCQFAINLRAVLALTIQDGQLLSRRLAS